MPRLTHVFWKIQIQPGAPAAARAGCRGSGAATTPFQKPKNPAPLRRCRARAARAPRLPPCPLCHPMPRPRPRRPGARRHVQPGGEPGAAAAVPLLPGAADGGAPEAPAGEGAHGAAGAGLCAVHEPRAGAPFFAAPHKALPPCSRIPPPRRAASRRPAPPGKVHFPAAACRRSCRSRSRLRRSAR